MSWQITANGHLNEQDDAAIEALATAIITAAKEADVGLTYVNVSHGGGSRVFFSASTHLDVTEETPVEEDGAEET